MADNTKTFLLIIAAVLGVFICLVLTCLLIGLVIILMGNSSAGPMIYTLE